MKEKEQIVKILIYSVLSQYFDADITKQFHILEELQKDIQIEIQEQLQRGNDG